MSELTKLCSRVACLKNDLERIVETPSTIEEIGKMLELSRIIQAEIEEKLLPQALKFENKRSYCDPVTGVARFGPNQILKIESVNAEVRSLQNETKEKVSRIHLYLETHLKRLEAVKLESECQEKLKDEISTQGSSLNVVEIDQTDEILHEKANRIREKKAAERMERMQAVKKLNDYLLKIKTGFNAQLSGIAQTQKILSLATKMTDKGSLPQMCTMLQTVSSIVGNITSKPDNQALRSLRFDHPVLQAKVTSIPCGCDLLGAIGFQMKFERADPTSDQALAVVDYVDISFYQATLHLEVETFASEHPSSGSKFASGDVSEDMITAASGDEAMNRSTQDRSDFRSDGQAASEIHDPFDTGLLGRLSSDLGWKVIFVMEEPSLDDSTKWLAWFDGLKEIEHAIAVTISNIRSLFPS